WTQSGIALAGIHGNYRPRVPGRQPPGPDRQDRRNGPPTRRQVQQVRRRQEAPRRRRRRQLTRVSD
ncbi:hypothetical protein, partial [Proteus mirabilis]|uniref:hypothetical protein n=1 Tax=Proteus mirabilis TaxID=584 RepID=UPI001954E191